MSESKPPKIVHREQFGGVRMRIRADRVSGRPYYVLERRDDGKPQYTGVDGSFNFTRMLLCCNRETALGALA